MLSLLTYKTFCSPADLAFVQLVGSNLAIIEEILLVVGRFVFRFLTVYRAACKAFADCLLCRSLRLFVLTVVMSTCWVFHGDRIMVWAVKSVCEPPAF